MGRRCDLWGVGGSGLRRGRLSRSRARGGRRFGRFLSFVGVGRVARVLAAAHRLILAATHRQEEEGRAGCDLVFQFHAFGFTWFDALPCNGWSRVN